MANKAPELAFPGRGPTHYVLQDIAFASWLQESGGNNLSLGSLHRYWHSFFHSMDFWLVLSLWSLLQSLKVCPDPPSELPPPTHTSSNPVPPSSVPPQVSWSYPVQRSTTRAHPGVNLDHGGNHCLGVLPAGGGGGVGGSAGIVH